MPDLLAKFAVIMQFKFFTMTLKRIFLFLLVVSFVVACKANKPYYKTKEGKKKQKYYNDIQFGGKSASEMKRP